jgi:hypothetical protein
MRLPLALGQLNAFLALKPFFYSMPTDVIEKQSHDN